MIVGLRSVCTVPVIISDAVSDDIINTQRAFSCRICSICACARRRRKLIHILYSSIWNSKPTSKARTRPFSAHHRKLGEVSCICSIRMHIISPTQRLLSHALHGLTMNGRLYYCGCLCLCVTCWCPVFHQWGGNCVVRLMMATIGAAESTHNTLVSLHSRAHKIPRIVYVVHIQAEITYILHVYNISNKTHACMCRQSADAERTSRQIRALPNWTCASMRAVHCLTRLHACYIPVYRV